MVRDHHDSVRSVTLSRTELDRYSRHIMLREVGGVGQRALKAGSVLVVGAGGLGSSALYYLSAAGVGRIGVIDDDVVESSNLQRQVIHHDSDIDMPKVFSAEYAMRALNPFVDVQAYHRRIDEHNAPLFIDDFDVILDGSDNFETRYLVNRVCVEKRKPLVSGALTQWEGQVSVFDPAKNGPCYQCLFPEPPADGLAPTCAEAGVIGPLPGVIGSMMALEAIKIVVGIDQTLRGFMFVYDALWAETRKIAVGSRSDCPICQKK